MYPTARALRIQSERGCTRKYLEGVLLTFCRFNRCVVAGFISLSLLASAGMAQNQQAPPNTQSPPTTQTAQPAQPAPAAQSTPQAPKTPTQPDYPDPRSLEIGVFAWEPITSTQPSIYGGSTAATDLEYETLTDIGKPRLAPGADASLPITRTGSLHLEIFRMEGTGNQNAPRATTVFTTAISQGDYLATEYKMTTAKLYLDDLLFPHKFPVERFRLKSLWEVQYVSFGTNINAPYVTTSIETASGTKSVILPTFGLAAEYAITPHIVARVDASGFVIPHHSDLYDAHAQLSWRIGSFEVVGGVKTLHAKTSPQSDEYISATVSGAFVGVRWFTPLFPR